MMRALWLEGAEVAMYEIARQGANQVASRVIDLMRTNTSSIAVWLGVSSSQASASRRRLSSG